MSLKSYLKQDFSDYLAFHYMDAVYKFNHSPKDQR